MLDRLTPYILFLLASALFIMFGGIAQSIFPLQIGLIIAEVACMLGFALFMQRSWREPKPMRWPSWRRAGGPLWVLGVIFAAGAVFGLFANLLGALVTNLVPGFPELALEYAKNVKKLLEPDSTALAIAGALSVSIFAPLCEEALFRGTLLPMQRENEPLFVALMLNGVIFALIHLNPIAMLPLFILGMILASLTARSNSIWPAIACHAGINTCNGVIIPAIMRYQGVDVTANPPLSQILPALAVFTLLAALTLRGLFKLLDRFEPTHPELA